MKKFIIKTPEIKKHCLAAVMGIMGDQNMEVIIREHEEDHTAEQRNFFHLLCREMSQGTGYTEGQIKELIKKDVLGTVVVEFAGRTKEVTESSEAQVKKRYSELIDGAYRIAAEAGVVLPAPMYREEAKA
jgi:hypothetical protein